MNLDLWKIWKVVTPREGIYLIGLVMLASFLIHLVVMLGGSDRYINGLLG